MSFNKEPDFYDDGSNQPGFTFECNAPSCRECYGEVGDFGQVWEGAKEQGWRAVKVGPDWKHLCPAHRGVTLKMGG